MNMVPISDDVRLRAATEDVIDAPPDILIATTGIGFRGWVEAAEGWGVAEALLAALGKARVIRGDPKPPALYGQPVCAKIGHRSRSPRRRCSPT